jgi:hypothetical protein
MSVIITLERVIHLGVKIIPGGYGPRNNHCSMLKRFISSLALNLFFVLTIIVQIFIYSWEIKINENV